MHGRLKVRTTEEQKAIKLKEQQTKLKEYRRVIEEIFVQRKLGKCDETTLNLTSKLLYSNPDIYTLWNIRREYLLAKIENCEVSKIDQELAEKELLLTEQCLKVNPKSYGAWHHRCWILDNCIKPDWKKEVLLCNKYLQYDDRNFHCWDYRRFVVKHAEISSGDELEFSTSKINSNFSNYSSWHYRSVLYKSLSSETNVFGHELNLVQNAAFTDPNDTSAWFYQRWLLGKVDTPLEIILCSLENQSIIVALNQYIEFSTLHFFINGSPLILAWTPLEENSKLSCVWTTHIPINIKLDVGKDILKISYIKNDTTRNLNLNWIGDQCCARGATNTKLGVHFGEVNRHILEAQLASCEELLELEPDSKWTLLTSSLLMRALGGYEYNNKSLLYLDKIQKYDTKRKSYYQDLRSRWLIEDFINARLTLQTQFDDVNLSDFSLTALYHMQYFSVVKVIDLSKNNLTNRSLKQLSHLVTCTDLRLKGNKITNINGLPKLPNLVSLDFVEDSIDVNDVGFEN